MTIPQAPPPPANGLSPKDHVGSLWRVVVHSVEPKSQTPWGEKYEVTVEIDVILGRIQQGEHFGPQRLSNTLLAPQLGQCVGREVYGRVEAKPGNKANPAIVLGALTSADEQTVREWLTWVQANGYDLVGANSAAQAPSQQADTNGQSTYGHTDAPASGQHTASHNIAPASFGQPAAQPAQSVPSAPPAGQAAPASPFGQNAAQAPAQGGAFAPSQFGQPAAGASQEPPF